MRTLRRTLACFAAFLPLAAGCHAPRPDGSARSGDGDADGQGRILIVLTNHAKLGDTGKRTGFYLSEASHPWRVFSQAGYAVDFASPTGGEAPIDPKSLDRSDPVNAAFLDDRAVTAQVRDTLAPGEVDPRRYRAIFYAGGHGAVWDLPDDRPLAKLAAEIYERGGAVGAVCHGPAGLVNVKLSDGSYLVQGKRVAAFTNAEEQAVGLTDVVPFLLADRLEERGAEHAPGENFQEQVVVDGRLVTGQNPASATKTAEELVRVLAAPVGGR